MTEAQARYDVRFDALSNAQIVIGDHTNVMTPEGSKVTYLLGESRPQLRAAPSGSRPESPGRPIGRESALELARRARPAWPLQLYGLDGIGKTTLVKHFAAEAVQDPVVYPAVRRCSLVDVQAMLFRAFWDADGRFVPAPDQMRTYLTNREAMVVLDDLALDRDDLAVLLETAPGCTFVVASLTRSLWESGAAHELRGLSTDESIQLLERALATTLGDEERASARMLAEACEGHPQTLVEIAAAVLDQRATLDELARGTKRASPAFDELDGDQRRLLDVLGSLSGSALGADHVGALAGVPDPEAALAELERLGWVKSQSPRYRLVQPLAGEDEDATLADLAHHLASWARSESTGPDQVGEESEAIEAALEQALARGRPDLALVLARATESKLAISGLLGSWYRVLSEGLSAVRTSGAGLPADEAYLLHQLGSRAIGVGDGRARQYLLQALEIRERLGDERGAALTRHNLEQLELEAGHTNGNRRGPARRGRWWLFGLVLLALVGAAVALLASRGEQHHVVTVEPKPPPGRPPVIAIGTPLNHAHFAEGRSLNADYVCVAAPGARLRECKGTVGGVAVDVGQALPSSVGRHVLVVEARDNHRRVSHKMSVYQVFAVSRPITTQSTPTPTQTQTTPTTSTPILPPCSEGLPTTPCKSPRQKR